MPNKYDYWGNLGDAYRMIPFAGDRATSAYKRAIVLAEEQIEINPKDAEVDGDLALYYARVGERLKAIQYLGLAIARDPKDYQVLRIACLVHLEAGQQSEALRWLALSVSEGLSHGQLLADPEFAPLRSLPQFSRLVEEAKNPGR